MKTLNHAVSSAQSQASKMFAEVGVTLEWHDFKNCGVDSLVVKLSSDTPEGLLAGALGHADYEHGEIVVFYDRVARRLPGKETVLLAHVLVHEIAHVLFGVSHHSKAGLMKASWEGEDISAMRFKPLPFGPGDIELLHRGLEARESRLALSESRVTRSELQRGRRGRCTIRRQTVTSAWASIPREFCVGGF